MSRIKTNKPSPSCKKGTKTPSKKDTILRLLRRKSGASVDELCNTTGWQPHSVRGFLSATVRKTMAGKLESSVTKSGRRVYRLSNDVGAVSNVATDRGDRS